jgi:hypothetical protein
VAARTGGRVIERRLQPPLLELRHGPWVTLADTASDPTGSGTTFTRLRTPYRVAIPFRMRIRKRGPFGGRIPWVGSRLVRIGRSEFDRRFSVVASSRGVARSLLLGTPLEEWLLAGPEVRIDLRPPDRRRRRALGPGIFEAVVRFPRVLWREEDLLRGFELAWRVVEELERVGVAKPAAGS